ncbi:hypothetical protein [Nocardioides terrigena]|uniref:hypothetical protein n=1 Tax=Nocardioides terrigena TaxID=424797 RepID=UPI00131EEA83|nr:hypothetical protein [Nocardioides terrigena]
MTTSDTIGRVPRPRGVLSDEQAQELEARRQLRDHWTAAYREWVVGLLADGCSFGEVSKATGLSKDTLQRWKREAK